MKMCFNCCVIQQYGLTETSGCISLTNHYDKTTNHVGGPLVCGEFCLKPIQNFDSIKDIAPTNFKGELLYRGVNLFKGYYTGNNQILNDLYQIDTNITDIFIDKDGWFHTGDYVSILKNGAICYLDRIDNMVKLKNDIILSYEKLERTIEMIPNIYQSFVYYDNQTAKIVALLVLNERLVEPNKEPDLLAHINTMCRNMSFNEDEIPKRVSILNSPFSIINGLLTPCFKLNREQIIKKYFPIINKLCSDI
jgi:long-chain acyl-CoA synthetase